MGKRRKLRKWMRRRSAEDAAAVVVCLGKSCADREDSRAVLAAAHAHAAHHHLHVLVEATNCLHVCKHGPIVATYPRIRFKKRVGKRRVRRLVDKVAARR